MLNLVLSTVTLNLKVICNVKHLPSGLSLLCVITEFHGIFGDCIGLQPIVAVLSTPPHM